MQPGIHVPLRVRSAGSKPFHLCCTLLVALSLTKSSARADELKYSRVDAATVRVFAYSDMTVRRFGPGSQGRYVVAVPEAGHGSGLMISPDGLILTAEHVVKGSHLIAVQLPGQQQALPARVVYSDEEHDYALLVVPGKHKSFVPMPDKSPTLAVRDKVFVIGYPLDATRSHPQSQQGIISGLMDDGLLQLGVALNPGNSGGPVVDPDEHLLGIAVARADPRAGAQGIGVAVPVSHLLKGYGKARGSERLQEAKKELKADGPRLQQEVNAVVGTLVSDQGNGPLEALAGDEGAAADSELAKALVDESDAPSALAMTLRAAELWNAAAVAIARGGQGSQQLARARELARRVGEVDADAQERSPLLQFLLQGHDPTDVQAPMPNVGTGDEIEDEAVAELMASLEVSRSLPTFRFGLTVGMMTPFHVIGFGVAAKSLIAETVSVQARYQYGWHYGDTGLSGSHLFEALGGVVLSSWLGTTTARLIVDVEHGMGTTTYNYVPGEVATVNTWVGEAGVLSGPVNLSIPDSADPTLQGPLEARQAYLLEAGVRYTYYYRASSPYLTHTAKGQYEFSVHLIAPPFFAPAGARNADGDRIDGWTPGLKGEFAWGSAPLSWGLSELGVGYMPVGDWIFVRIGWTYLF
ncbi:MAG: S1C family serine protease [Myxococcales bacterium]|nr:S1C family serine protease [Myxococcales bacterium]